MPIEDIRRRALEHVAALVPADAVDYVPYDDHFLARAPIYIQRFIDEPPAGAREAVLRSTLSRIGGVIARGT